ncbi:MAG TPA: DinB family protein [Flavobacterium sp.]|uniref:DinB family protein n=1 Tax=Flavobacterium sp. TaxID=239 RepID=UPI002B56DC56|nr:DinB family protein [Flavobacterium sp.]HNP33010.1 DinB family protein [Flavobacterium sp.]
MLINSLNKALNELVSLLNQLSSDDFTSPCKALSNSTIGEHTRHIIEMFQCLENQYESGVVNYDKRNRDYRIQSDTNFALHCIADIKSQLLKEDKKLKLQQFIDCEEILIDSNYFRELLYNLEHCIHHQALIKVAVLQFDHLQIDDNFGVARSTIEYRKQCAQ